MRPSGQITRGRVGNGSCNGKENMLRTTLTALLFSALLILPSCMKGEQKVNFSPDNTGTIAFKMSMKTEVMDTMKAMIEQAGAEADSGQIDKLGEAVDVKVMEEKLKKQGVEITSAKSVDADGWKGYEIVGKVANVNEFCEKAKKAVEEEIASQAAESGPGNMGGEMGKMMLAFFKTEDPAIGSLQILPPMGDFMAQLGDGDNPLARLDDASEEELQMFEGMMEMMKQQFALDQMAMSMIIGVPGEITTMKGCTKSEDGKSVVFSIKGGDINLQSLKTMMGMKDGVSVDFKIPADCKIEFKDRPKKEAKAEPKKEEPKKEKKGDLKTGDGG